MAGGGQRGVLLVEALLLVVVLGVGLAGLARVTAASLQGAGEVKRRMRARELALGALEQGYPGPPVGVLAVTLQPRGPGCEARVAWRERGGARDLRLRGRHGRP